MIGTEGTRLLREKRVQGRPHRRKGAEEASGPPAESECPTFQSTIFANSINIELISSLEPIIKIGSFSYRIR
ncbi:hypothetical protein DOZ91_21300 [Peribacillus frigoritolerans]|nr:hypothetical protein DOZ91_21300 [Peribacillus frigoritolerans]